MSVGLCEYLIFSNSETNNALFDVRYDLNFVIRKFRSIRLERIATRGREKAFSEVSVLDSVILFPIQTKPGKQNYTQNKGVQKRISSAWWCGRLRLVGDSVSAAAAFDQSQPPWTTPESTMGDLHAASNPIWNFFVKIPLGTEARCLKCKES